MPRFDVTFTQITGFIVEADTEEDAFYEALAEFRNQMRRPVARTDYDSYEIRLRGDENEVGKGSE